MDRFPPIPLEAWRPTKETIHRFTQIVGKVRLASMPYRNHWWNVPLYPDGRGITTGLMGRDGRLFEIAFDFVDHELVVTTLDGRSRGFDLEGLSVAGFYSELMDTLDEVDRAVSIVPRPFDLPDTTPFPEDEAHAAYDPEWAGRYWWVLSQVGMVLSEFAGRHVGKTSPVHHFWHTFDLALTFFSGREAPLPDDVDPVTREAYSHEVISFGFWFGDDNVPEPALYSYTAPEPPGLADRPLVPEGARWIESRGSHLAVLPYEVVRQVPDPAGAMLDFYASAFEAGAALTDWPVGLQRR